MNIFFTIWVVSGVLYWGLMYAYFSRNWPNQCEPRMQYIAIACLGPFALAAGILALIHFNGLRNAFKYGFKL